MKTEDIAFKEGESRVYRYINNIFKGDLLVVTYDRYYRIRFAGINKNTEWYICTLNYAPDSAYWEKVDIETFDELLTEVLTQQLLGGK